MVITLICVPVVALMVITLICVLVVALMVITLICVRTQLRVIIINATTGTQIRVITINAMTSRQIRVITINATTGTHIRVITINSTTGTQIMVITLICVPVVALMVIVGQPVVTKENKHIYFLKNGPKHRKYPGFYEYLATDVTSRTYGTKIFIFRDIVCILNISYIFHSFRLYMKYITIVQARRLLLLAMQLGNWSVNKCY
jgi:hypothetical protein